MSIFAISDLHLSFMVKKPMNIFGINWYEHEENIKNDWLKRVKQEDVVLLPGDFSWANTLQETFRDFEYLERLPGKKLLLKGNHDYWWNSLTKMRQYLRENNFNTIDFIHNNSYLYENYIIVGTRGWGIDTTLEDRKIVERENIRLEISLQDGIKKYGTDRSIIVNIHYPPDLFVGKAYDFISIMEKYKVKQCIYGHLHGETQRNIQHPYIDFKLVSCDYTDFKLTELS